MFGSELRRRRTEAGLSLSQLAERAGYSKSYLSKVEAGAKPPNPSLARRCDLVLQASGQLSGLIEAPERAAPAPPAVDADRDWLIRLNIDGTTEFHTVGDGLAALADTSRVVSMRLPAPAGLRGVADHDLLAYRAVFDALRGLAQTTHPADLIPILASGARTVNRLAARTSAPGGAEFLRTAARYAELAGWMAQEAGDSAGARWWTGAAVTTATEAGDRDLQAYCLVRLAELALYQSDARATIMLAQQAQEDARAPRIRGLAAQREAQGYALAGQANACHGALGRAASLLADAAGSTSAGEPVLGTTTAADPMAFVTGWCLHDLGSLDEAVPVLDTELSRLPAAARRAVARHSVRLSLACSETRKIDRACEVARPVLRDAVAIGSATARADLVLLNRSLRRWHQHEGARDIRTALLEVLAADQPAD
jgi:transcriptional regulator with XRE-family HTH domain